MRKTLRRLFVGCLGIALLAGGYIFYAGSKSNGDSAAYTTEPVVRGNITRVVSATGKIQAVNTVEVGSQVSGTIRKIYVDYNSSVKKGQLIAEIDASVLMAKVKESEANLSSMKASWAESAATLKEARREYDRQKNLYAKNFIARSDLESAETSSATASAQLAAAKAKLDAAQATLEQNRTNLAYAQIYSPVNGTVVGKNVSEGQTVASSYQTPTLFTIAEDLTKMQVEAAVDEADIGYVKEGMPVGFTVDTYPEDTFKGIVRQVRLMATTTENVVTYTVIISAENPNLRLYPGMTANVTIETASAKNVLKVSNAALRFKFAGSNGAKNGNGSGSGSGKAAQGKGSARQVVWVLPENKDAGSIPMRVPVSVGLTDGSWTAVSGDLAEGDLVVTGSRSDSGGTASRANMPPRMF
jgi:HlyD family secretion protein